MKPELLFKPGDPIDLHLQHVYKDKKYKGKLIPLHEILSIDSTDPDWCWYPIPCFNGYEMCRYGIVRSMKHFNRYPYGILIRYDKKYRYNLSTINNDRVEISMDELWKLVSESDQQPRTSNMRDIGARNQRLFLQTDDTLSKANCKIKKKHVPTNKKEDTFFPKFTILSDGDQGISPLEFYD